MSWLTPTKETLRALPATDTANALAAGTDVSSRSLSKRSASAAPFTRAHSSAGGGDAGASTGAAPVVDHRRSKASPAATFV